MICDKEERYVENDGIVRGIVIEGWEERKGIEGGKDEKRDEKRKIKEEMRNENERKVERKKKKIGGEEVKSLWGLWIDEVK